MSQGAQQSRGGRIGTRMRPYLRSGGLSLVLVYGSAVGGANLASEGAVPGAPAGGTERALAPAVALVQPQSWTEQSASDEKVCDVQQIPAAGDFEAAGAGYQRYFWNGSRRLDEVITESLNEVYLRYDLAGRPGEFICRSSFRELGTFGKRGSTTGYVALLVTFPLDQGPKIAYYVYYLACEKRRASEEPRLLETEEVREAAERFREEYVARVSSKAEEQESEAEDD